MDWDGIEYFLRVNFALGNYQMKFTNKGDWSGQDWADANGLAGTVTETKGGGANIQISISNAGNYLIRFNLDSMVYSIDET